MSLFKTVTDKEPHILRRWKNGDWRGEGVKGWYNTTANPMMNTCERVTALATQVCFVHGSCHCWTVIVRLVPLWCQFTWNHFYMVYGSVTPWIHFISIYIHFFPITKKKSQNDITYDSPICWAWTMAWPAPFCVELACFFRVCVATSPNIQVRSTAVNASECFPALWQTKAAHHPRQMSAGIGPAPFISCERVQQLCF